MVAILTELPEMFEDGGRAEGGIASRELRDDTYETVLGDRTRGPAVSPVVGKPVVRQFVVDVLGTEERDEQIDVEERDARHALLVAQPVDDGQRQGA
jgi:hypothetical protein